MKKTATLLLTVILCCLLLSGCQATKQRRIIPFYVDPESFLSKEQYFYVDEFNHAQEPVSEQVWDRALPFKNGVGLVVDNDLWGVVDEKCNYITLPQWDYVSPIDPVSGLMQVTLDDKCGYINRNGELVLPLNWDTKACMPFSEGLAAVKDENGKGWGYMNSSGQLVIDYSWQRCEKFSEGKATVELSDGYGYINKKGDLLIESRDWVSALDFHYDVACVSTYVNGKELWGVINQKGEYIIDPHFLYACWNEDYWDSSDTSWHLEDSLENHEESLYIYLYEGKTHYVYSEVADSFEASSGGILNLNEVNNIW